MTPHYVQITTACKSLARPRLVDAGLVEETAQRPAVGDDQRRRYYRLTGLGREVCIAESDRLADLIRRTRTNLRPRTA